MKKSIFKTALSAILSLALVTAFVPTAYAADSGSSTSGSDEIVGKLSIVASYHPGADFTDGHSFLMFTSYKDNLSLNFTDLYGYYVPSDEYSAAEALDHSLASHYSNVRVAMTTMYPGLTSEEYAAMEADYDSLSSADREAKYPGLAAAIKEYQQSCFTEKLGTQSSDGLHRKIDKTFTLNKGEYLTIGNYSMQDSTEQMVIDALMNSTLKDRFVTDLQANLTQGYTVDQIMQKLEEFLEDYAAGKYTYDQIKEAVSNYLIAAVGQTVFEDVIMPYLFGVNIIDGDTTGGLFVNREMYRQKDWQDFDPDHVYSVEITQAQLDKLMAYLNSGSANHYSLAAHNCTTMAADAWNAAVGYDDSGDETTTYINSKDTTFAWLENMISTPKRVYEVTANLPGGAQTMSIVRGVEVPNSTTPTASDYTFTAPENAKYDGTTQWSATLTPTTYTDDQIMLFYSSDNGTTWTTEAPIAAGTYLVKANVAASDAHTEATGLTDSSWTFTVAQRSVTLTSGSAEKAYDGEALICGDLTASGDGFVEGEGIAFTITGTQTEVGTSENTFTYTFQEGTKASNYEITSSYGTLKVNESLLWFQYLAETGDQTPLVALFAVAIVAALGSIVAGRKMLKLR